MEIVSGPSLAERFTLQKEVLLSVSKDTEQEFVAFGQETGSLVSQSRTILAKVNEVLEVATGDTAREAVDLFDLFITDTERIIEIDQTDVETLIIEMTALRQQIEALFQHRQFIEDAALLPLALLKIGFRVEGASRLQTITKILDAVGVEAATLGKKVVASTHTQFETLTIAGSSMKRLIASLNGMIDEMHREEEKTAKRINELKRHAAQLREARQDQDKVGREIETTGKELQREFNRVVMALQYHDITRQQLEHVAEAFESTLPGLSHNTPSLESEALLHQTVRIQIHQTQAALESLKQAGTEFHEGLDQISHRAGELENNVENFRSLCRNDEVLKALQGLVELQTMIEERTTIKRGVGEAACLIFEKVVDCTSSLNELTLDLRILAINAQVQAANAEHHAVVEMLAKEMCDVSNAIKNASEALTNDMQTVMKSLANLATRAWKLGTQQTKEGHSIHQEMPHCIDLLNQMQENVTVGLAESSSLQADLQSRIAVLLRKVNFPLVASERLLTVLRFFREVEGESMPDDENATASLRALASMETNYTMASEREVHAIALAKSGLSSKNSAGIELFEEPASLIPGGASKPDVKPGATKVEDFGDNIELF